MLNIQPIRLLKGCHPTTGDTGSGCFLNVCSYLQGDKVITDNPTSVNGHLRAPLVILNDLLPDVARQALLPFVHRAMLTGAEHRSYDTVNSLMLLAELVGDLQGIVYDVGAKVDAPSRRSFEEWADTAMRHGDPHILSDNVAHALKNVLKAVRDVARVRVQRYEGFSLNDYRVGRPGPEMGTYRKMDVIEVAVEKIVAALDKALPNDVEPRPIVAARAALLVEVKKEWGDRPLPQSSAELCHQNKHDIWGVNPFKSGADAKAMLAFMESMMLAHPMTPMYIGVDFAKDAFKPVAAPKKNTPKGPLKLHKPLFI